MNEPHRDAAVADADQTGTIAMTLRKTVLATGLLAATLALSACQSPLAGLDAKAFVPIPAKLERKMKAKGMTPASPIMLRIFKEESALEVWKRTNTGRYALLETYDICKWSGKLGPKFKEGDRQAPEGFYFVNKHQMNPRSSYHLSFNMGFPNRFDRAHGRTGSHLMVHGACSSAGCYSMTDDYIEDIYALAREAHAGGQKAFQIQAFPFRMTPKNMARHKDSKHFAFWKNIKRGYDYFELTKRPPKIDVCGKRYVFNTKASGPYRPTAACPKMTVPNSLAVSYMKRLESENATFERLAARAENRDPKDLPPLTYATALPNLTVEGAVKAQASGELSGS